MNRVITIGREHGSGGRHIGKIITETYQVSEKVAEKMILQTDKDRASYYQYHTGQRWGNSQNYDLCLNTSSMSEEDAAELMLILQRNIIKEDYTDA